VDFSDLQVELSEIIAESGVKTFSLAARKRWINEGVVDVCRLTRCLTKEVTRDISAALQFYGIVSSWAMSDFLQFAKEGIRHYNGSSTAPLWTMLERKSVEWLDENVTGWRDTSATNQSDTISYYAKYGLSIYFQPVPKTAVTAGWIISYHYYPISGTTIGGLVNATDKPFDNFPELYPYHRLPALFAGYRALLKAGAPKARQVMEEYAAGIKLMKQELGMEPDREPEIALFNYRAT